MRTWRIRRRHKWERYGQGAGARWLEASGSSKGGAASQGARARECGRGATGMGGSRGRAGGGSAGAEAHSLRSSFEGGHLSSAFFFGMPETPFSVVCAPPARRATFFRSLLKAVTSVTSLFSECPRRRSCKCPFSDKHYPQLYGELSPPTEDRQSESLKVPRASFGGQTPGYSLSVGKRK